MNRTRKLAFASAIAGVTLVVGVRSVIAQQDAPTQTKGVTIKQLDTIDLGPEIHGMTGRQFRLRLITVEPGGVLGLHDHKDRPAIDYVIQGTLTDHRGADAKDYGPGMSIVETTQLVHWVENKGTTPAVLVSSDIFKQP
jgi:quercetin dioxygenase-like cupin family protein